MCIRDPNDFKFCCRLHSQCLLTLHNEQGHCYLLRCGDCLRRSLRRYPDPQPPWRLQNRFVLFLMCRQAVTLCISPRRSSFSFFHLPLLCHRQPCCSRPHRDVGRFPMHGLPQSLAYWCVLFRYLCRLSTILRPLCLLLRSLLVITVRKVLSHFSTDQIFFILHPFPLTMHRQAWDAAQVRPMYTSCLWCSNKSAH